MEKQMQLIQNKFSVTILTRHFEGFCKE